jgi:hypothetical protein
MSTPNQQNTHHKLWFERYDAVQREYRVRWCFVSDARDALSVYRMLRYKDGARNFSIERVGGRKRGSN